MLPPLERMHEWAGNEHIEEKGRRLKANGWTSCAQVPPVFESGTPHLVSKLAAQAVGSHTHEVKALTRMSCGTSADRSVPAQGVLLLMSTRCGAAIRQRLSATSESPLMSLKHDSVTAARPKTAVPSSTMESKGHSNSYRGIHNRVPANPTLSWGPSRVPPSTLVTLPRSIPCRFLARSPLRWAGLLLQGTSLVFCTRLIAPRLGRV